MAKKVSNKGYSTNRYGSNEHPFMDPKRPDMDWVYNTGMVPEKPEFGSAPSKAINGRYLRYPFGVAGFGEHIEDGISGADRHIDYIVPPVVKEYDRRNKREED